MYLESLAAVLADRRTDPAPVIAASANVAAAAALMSDRHADALVAMDGDALAGVVTAQDVVTRAVAARRDLASTRVAELLEQPAGTLSREVSAFQALRWMDARGCQHVAVDGERGPCILSRRDLTDWVIRTQQAELDCAIGAVKQLGFANRRG